MTTGGAAVSGVAERAPDLAEAARLLADWGFLARPDLPDREGPAYLLVALRDPPTLRHFDPELVEYWVSVNDRGVRRSITRGSPTPLATTFSWGPIRIADRLHVTNEYLAFGGSLRADRVDDALIVVFTSPAPLLRRGGHSQGWDPGADSLGAHFGRFLAAVDCVPGFERAAARADPLTRYATFLVDTTTRYCSAPSLPRPQDELLTLLRAETHRLQATEPEAWQRGVALWDEIGGGASRPAPDGALEAWSRPSPPTPARPLVRGRVRAHGPSAEEQRPSRPDDGGERG